MLSVWLQNVSSHWLWWLGHRCVICRGTDDGSGGSDPEDIAVAPCLLGPLCRDSAPFSVTFMETAQAEKRLWVKFVFFFFRKKTCFAGLCAATREIALLVKSWAALFLSEMRFEDSASTDKKERKEDSWRACGLGSTAAPAVKEQGEGEVLKSKEQADLFLRDVKRVMECFFFCSSHSSPYMAQKRLGSVEFTPLFSEGLILAGERKWGWLAYFTFPPVFHLIWETPGKKKPIFT